MAPLQTTRNILELSEEIIGAGQRKTEKERVITLHSLGTALMDQKKYEEEADKAMLDTIQGFTSLYGPDDRNIVLRGVLPRQCSPDDRQAVRIKTWI